MTKLWRPLLAWGTRVTFGLVVIVVSIIVATDTHLEEPTRVLLPFLLFLAWGIVELMIEFFMRESAVQHDLTNLKDWFALQYPRLNALELLPTAQAADIYLRDALKNAVNVRNTRISAYTTRSPLSTTKAHSNIFRDSLPLYLRRRQRTFRELIADSGYFLSESQRLSTTFETYDYRIWHNAPHFFTNFTLIEYEDSARQPEVVLGWAVAAGLGGEQHCFILRNVHLHAFYAAMFEALWHSLAPLHTDQLQ